MDASLDRIANLIQEANHLFAAYIKNKDKQSYVMAYTNIQGENENMPKINGGSLRKRANGTWEIRYYDNNKQKSIYGKNQKDLIKRFTQVKRTKKQKQEEPKHYKFKHWLDEWYKIYKQPKLKESSLYNISNSINKYILPYFEEMSLKDISPLQIQKLLNSITKQRAMEMTANVLRESLRKAYELQLTQTNLFVGVEVKKVKSIKRRAFSKEEIKSILNSIAEKEYGQLIRFLLLTGMRRSEALKIKWEDIDFNNNFIHIKGEKTESADRLFPINVQLKELILEIEKSTDCLFHYKPNSVTQKFTKIVRELKYENVSLHSLRHTFATNCMEKGINTKLIQTWLGHSNYNVTADIYTHVNNQYNKNQADELDFSKYLN